MRIPQPSAARSAEPAIHCCCSGVGPLGAIGERNPAQPASSSINAPGALSFISFPIVLPPLCWLFVSVKIMMPYPARAEQVRCPVWPCMAGIQIVAGSAGDVGLPSEHAQGRFLRPLVAAGGDAKRTADVVATQRPV